MGRGRKRVRGGGPDGVNHLLQREYTVTCTYYHETGILVVESSQLCNYQFLLNWIP